MDTRKVMNMQKETEKLKKLTQKLRETGDITENEADWIYILRLYTRMSYVRRNSQSREFSAYVANNFLILSEQDLKNISQAFREWYEEVCNKVESGKDGNFLSTVFYNGVSSRETDEEMAVHELTNRIMNTLRERNNENVLFQDEGEISSVFSKISEHRCLVSDISYFPYGHNGPVLKLARYGLLSRRSNENDKNALKGITKEGIYLAMLSAKLKDEDITQEEADNVYLLLKYAQTLTALRYKERGYYKAKVLKEQSEKLFNYLSVWYKTVYEAVKDGRSGNFLSTLPAGLNIHTGKAGVYVKKTLKLLPANIEFIRAFNGTIQLPSPSLDVEAEKKEMTSVMNSRGRYSGINVDLSGYITIKKEDGTIGSLTFRWMMYIEDKYIYIPNTFTKNNRIPCPGFVAKLEALIRDGIYPILVEKRNIDGTISSFTMLHKKDYEKARYILEIPDEEIESRAYKVAGEKVDDKNEISKAFSDAVRIVRKLANTERSRDEYVENAWIPDR
jgi:hypothetical protein